MYRSSIGAALMLLFVALFATSCASGASGKAEITNESEASGISEVYIEKHPDCDSNEFKLTGRIADDAPTPILKIRGPILTNDTTSTTVTSTGLFTATAIAPEGIESIFGLVSGNVDVLLTVEVQGLIDKDCSPFGF